MPGKFCVSLTFAKDNPDKATVAFVIANAAVASDNASRRPETLRQRGGFGSLFPVGPHPASMAAWAIQNIA